MHELILWCAFVGAWLLFAGPLFQAVLELRSEEIEFDRIRAVATSVPAPPRPSSWWWLLPPVGWFLRRRRRDRHRQLMLEAMSDEDFDALTGYINKAVSWMLVGAGGFLIATKETNELTEGLEWPTVVFWLLVVVMTALGIAHTLLRLAHDRHAAAARFGQRLPD